MSIDFKLLLLIFWLKHSSVCWIAEAQYLGCSSDMNRVNLMEGAMQVCQHSQTIYFKCNVAFYAGGPEQIRIVGPEKSETLKCCFVGWIYGRFEG